MIKTEVVSQYHNEFSDSTYKRLQEKVEDGWQVLHSWRGNSVMPPNAMAGYPYHVEHEAQHFLLGKEGGKS